jgi:hypothetical protein
MAMQHLDDRSLRRRSAARRTRFASVPENGPCTDRDGSLEAGLWTQCIRTFDKLARDARSLGRDAAARVFAVRAAEMRRTGPRRGTAAAGRRYELRVVRG